MNKLLSGLAFDKILSESKSITANGKDFLNTYRSWLMNNYCTAGIVNRFVNESRQYMFDDGIISAASRVGAYLTEHRYSWQLLSVCEAVSAAQPTVFNTVEKNAVRHIQNLLELNENELIDAVKTGAMKDVMMCENLGRIAKDIYKTCVFEDTAKYGADCKSFPAVSFAIKNDNTYIVNIMNENYMYDGEDYIAYNGPVPASYNIVNNFLKTADICEHSVETPDYTITKGHIFSKKTGVNLTVAEFNEHTDLLTKAMFEAKARTTRDFLGMISYIAENFDSIMMLDGIRLFENKYGRVAVIENTNCDNIVLCSDKRRSKPCRTISEAAEYAGRLIKSDITADYAESINEEVSRGKAADNKEEITESHTRELNERRQRIADLCEQFKDDPAKLALLNAAAQELALIK